MAARQAYVEDEEDEEEDLELEVSLSRNTQASLPTLLTCHKW